MAWKYIVAPPALPSSEKMFQAADFLNDPVHLYSSIWSPLNQGLSINYFRSTYNMRPDIVCKWPVYHGFWSNLHIYVHSSDSGWFILLLCLLY